MLRYGIRLSVAVATFLLSLLISAVPTPSPASAPAAPRAASEREILEANRAYLEAHMSRDVEALDRLLADDFTISGRYVRGENKARRLALVSDSGLTFRYTDQDAPRVVAGVDVGEVTGRAVVQGGYMGRECTSPPYRYVRKFERREGHWQVVRVEVFRADWD